MTVYSLKSQSIKKPRKLRTVILVMVLLLLMAGGAFAVYLIYKNSTKDADPVEGREVSLGYYDPNQKFETDWFTFEAPKSWRYEEKESKDGRYVYRSYRSENVEQELMISVNKPLSDMRSVYMSAVTVSEDKLNPGTVSDRCSTYVPKSNFTSNPMDVVYEGAKFSCWVDGRSSYLGFSQVGGSSEFVLLGSDDEAQSYYFRFLDSRFSAQYQEVLNMIRSFQAK